MLGIVTVSREPESCPFVILSLLHIEQLLYAVSVLHVLTQLIFTNSVSFLSSEMRKWRPTKIVLN